jgi:nucleotidyltransferase substrate binding protein (TIGR01987 family)
MSEMTFAIEKLNAAWEKLKHGAETAQGELELDGVIQRFEFTFELFWKTLKIFLKHEGIEASSPKECLKAAFRLGWLESEGVYLDMLEDRNKTSHIYERSMAEDIIQRIKDKYISAIRKLLEILKTKI